MMQENTVGKFLNGPVKVVNIGLEGFAAELKEQGIESTQVDWKPPSGGDVKLAELLSKLGA